MYAGLYVLGAISSLGKTTFIYQMAEQMAKLGNHVIYISLEQSKLELASKSIAREIYVNNKENAITSLQIRKNPINDAVHNAIENIKTYADKLTVVECAFGMTMSDIEDYVKEYSETYNGAKPVLIVDYLQAIKPENDKMNTKEQIDTTMKRLKNLQIENQMVILAISSINRGNYLNQIDFESFKESGGIEYTADVIWGLQLAILKEQKYLNEKDTEKKRQMIKEAKKASVRRIELVCLKNRFGISNYTCQFDYHTAFDYFESDINSVDEMFKKVQDKDGWINVTDDMEIPF